MFNELTTNKVTKVTNTLIHVAYRLQHKNDNALRYCVLSLK